MESVHARFGGEGLVLRDNRDPTSYPTRERKMDHEGHSYTQSYLAQVLGISEQALRDLENKDASMDDFSRRQFLSKWLAIPPILLGIITRDEIDKLVEQQRAEKSGIVVVSTPIPTSRKLLRS